MRLRTALKHREREANTALKDRLMALRPQPDPFQAELAGENCYLYMGYEYDHIVPRDSAIKLISHQLGVSETWLHTCEKNMLDRSNASRDDLVTR